MTTRIEFLAHKLILRYKEGGSDKAFTIHKEFSPSPQSALKTQVGNGAPPGLRPSKIITKDVVAEMKKSVFLQATGSIPLDQLKDKITAFLGGFETRGLIELKQNSKNVGIICNSPETALSIQKALNKGNQDGFVFQAQIFD